MSYPYKSGLENYSQYLKTLPELAETSDKKQIGRFCSGLDHVKAYSLDKLKSPLRKQRGTLYRSVDAVYEGADRRRYFIEFKDQPICNIAPDADKLIEKAVDSLVIGSFTFDSDRPVVDTMSVSEFILVYDGPDDKFLGALSSLAGTGGAPKDEFGESILFGLDRLTSASFYSKVHTWTASTFREHFISNLP